MKIDNRYEIRIVLLEHLGNELKQYHSIGNINVYHSFIGDVYDSFDDFIQEHPYSSYEFGYVVFDTIEGCVPELCNEWNDSLEKAMMDYVDNCK